jgi:hypothetical protein
MSQAASASTKVIKMWPALEFLANSQYLLECRTQPNPMRNPMRIQLKAQPQPFRFLLYTEWLMLGSCGVMAAIEAWQRQSIPVQHILILVALGVMGWMLPSGKTPMRYLYTAVEIGLILWHDAGLSAYFANALSDCADPQLLFV